MQVFCAVVWAVVVVVVLLPEEEEAITCEEAATIGVALAEEATLFLSILSETLIRTH